MDDSLPMVRSPAGSLLAPASLQAYPVVTFASRRPRTVPAAGRRDLLERLVRYVVLVPVHTGDGTHVPGRARPARGQRRCGAA